MKSLHLQNILGVLSQDVRAVFQKEFHWLLAPLLLHSWQRNSVGVYDLKKFQDSLSGWSVLTYKSNGLIRHCRVKQKCWMLRLHNKMPRNRNFNKWDWMQPSCGVCFWVREHAFFCQPGNCIILVEKLWQFQKDGSSGDSWKKQEGFEDVYCGRRFSNPDLINVICFISTCNPE